ncbi:hypothetical protein HT665_05700 [Ursidibacter maritimus]|uniref:Immunity protein 53 n=1 Tax=Ursidibacter maritimus TaxID=1331689 RepID=A0A949T005_9PAST|nr:Imm53 family immunity protein [Ursidibacter maritimus]KAE9540205.1 hypothetical protein A1D26_03290 [Ursidibacter maritimus]MBV6524350.1 hypothetical protein [Ursidibacter maritimus]MBV6526370.1 hypothetical protein [Ursidibacter maritimus]MBV6527899.1 hypothetical protein [Ursidibacter maritimus]MBV6529148.1 hypothetical protein [Ursidibacter maritimus]
MKDFLTIINTWYQSKCDGVWEHSYGFSLDNIDNPGWCIRITGENSKEIWDITNSIDTEDNWLIIKSDNHSFTGYSGVLSFNKLLEYAVNWLEVDS